MPPVEGHGGALLQIDRVRAAAGDTTILHDVCLALGHREVVALLGPSGCGKTTLLRVVAGLQPLQQGRVLLEGADLAGVAPHRRAVGLMFQHLALFPHRDVAGNVEFGLRMQGLAAGIRSARVNEVLALVGLEGFGSRPVSTLSGGEQQRVALARALAPAPRVLMLDEPLGALDRRLRDRLVLDLRGLFAELGITVLYVTHDQAEALAIADRVAVMDRGRIVQTGTPQQVWARPRTPFVAEFLGFTNVVEVDATAEALHASWGAFASTDPVVPGPATVLIRPTGVRLHESGGSGVGTITGTVESHAFLGGATLVRLRLGADTRLEAEVGRRAPPVGSQVSIEIDPAAVVVLDATEGLG
jgi:thiamine transport system ATP-binding protein